MSQQPPEDKTFQQAWQDLHQRLTKTLSAEMDKRLGRMMGNTMESLTRDIEDEDLREHTTKGLLLVKIVSMLGVWQQQGFLNQSEYHELEQFIRMAGLGQATAPGDSPNDR